jgi:hypothetical protein
MEMRQGTFSSQIIAEMHLVAQPVGPASVLMV